MTKIRSALMIAALMLGAVGVAVPSAAQQEAKTCNGLEVTISGTDEADTLQGTDGPDVIASYGGDDTINGKGGDDVICAGAGNDVIGAGAGNDRIFGQAGSDTLSGGKGDDRINGGGGDDVISGDRGRDQLRGGSGDDALDGGLGKDRCNAGTGAGGDTAIACEAGQGACPSGYILDAVGQCVTLNLGCVLPNVELSFTPGAPEFADMSNTSCSSPEFCVPTPAIDGKCSFAAPAPPPDAL